ncbi:phenylacetate--CoA ligase family protein [Winogradskyella alexanderae]|uniref:Phenylacetate-CoA ligase n=1 Tax=Winogradskyella alexanderae TaxID=2877123 RepID=A0ABS7XQR2_9FLAO|nr:hypothetical protein [Winogradskyella alexanderae]MCA0131302.1 hypothetical protein [Winogradskyella alexanderae]
MHHIKSLIEFNLKHNSLLDRKISEIDTFYQNENIEEQKNQKLLQLINKTSKNKFYKDFYKSHDVDITKIKDFRDLGKLPIITKNDVKNNADLIKQKPFLIKGYTSGTTGSPLVVYRDLKSIVAENAYVWWYRLQYGLSPKDKKISIRGDLGKNKLFYYDSASKTLHISSFNINSNTFKQIETKIKELKPKALLGYPSSLLTLASIYKQNNQYIKIPLVFTSSETLYGYQEDLICEVFSSKIADWYGNSERTIALYRDGKKYYEPLLYSINEYRSNSILTTSLINDAFPLINYIVNDTVKTDLKYSERNKSIVIDGILGRSESSITLEDGSKIGAAALSLIFKDMDILNSQIIQKSPNSFTFNIVIGTSFKSKKELYKKIIQKLGTEVNIEIKIVTEEEIVYTDSGKYSLVMNSQE